MGETDLISRQDAIDVANRADYRGLAVEDVKKVTDEVVKELKQLPSAQPEHPLLKIIQDFKEMTGCEDVLVVQKDAMKAWDENGVAYTMQPERKKGEWIYGENDGQDGWFCSKCGFFVPWYYKYYGLDNFDFIADYHICPNCDTEMLKYTGMRGEKYDSD